MPSWNLIESGSRAYVAGPGILVSLTNTHSVPTRTVSDDMRVNASNMILFLNRTIGGNGASSETLKSISAGYGLDLHQKPDRLTAISNMRRLLARRLHFSGVTMLTATPLAAISPAFAANDYHCYQTSVATSIERMSDQDLLSLLLGRARAEALAGRPLTEIFGFRSIPHQTLAEAPVHYAAHSELVAAKELLSRCMIENMRNDVVKIGGHKESAAYLCSKIGHLDYEVFWCLWLNTKGRLIHAEEMFRGTLASTSVHPREVVKRALHLNAHAVILAHNHPSGDTEPSTPDRSLTSMLKQALALVDVKVLDHIIVTGNQASSFAHNGWI